MSSTTLKEGATQILARLAFRVVRESQRLSANFRISIPASLRDRHSSWKQADRSASGLATPLISMKLEIEVKGHP